MILKSGSIAQARASDDGSIGLTIRPMNPRLRPPAFLLVAVLVSSSLAQAAEPSWVDRQRHRAMRSITEKELRADIELLTSDELAGRKTGSAGNRAAAELIAQRFQRLGLKPAGDDDGYLQRFHLARGSLGPENRFRLGPPSQAQESEVMRHFYPARQGAPQGQSEAEVVFVGFGITAPEIGYDDYQGVDVRDKIALIMRGEPREDDAESAFDGEFVSEHGEELRKLLNAQEHGASGVILMAAGPSNFRVSARLAWPSNPSLQRYALDSESEHIRIPAVYASTAHFSSVLESQGLDLRRIREEIDSDLHPRSRPLSGLSALIRCDVQRSRLPAANVLGLWPGSDEGGQEAVVVGAHFDHLGIRGERILRGADDNASGTAALLEIAEAMSLARTRPARSILFAAWDAEEESLLGSRHYMTRPAVPVEKTVAMLQMDMIGRNEEVKDPNDFRFNGLDLQSPEENENTVNVLGYSRSPGLRSLVARSNRRILLRVLFRYDDNPINLLRRSDHWPFLQRGVPALLFTSGLHPDYHTPGDTAEKLNYSKIESIARLVFLSAWSAAEARAPGAPPQPPKQGGTSHGGPEQR